MACAIMRTRMHGYNGNLLLLDRGVTIERGLKGLLVRKRQSASLLIPREDVRAVWFQPRAGRWSLPGYVLVVAGADAPGDEFVARIRDDRAVTFLARSDAWREFAEAVALRCGVGFREFPAETRSGVEVVKAEWPRSDREWRF